jgi:hypothetical protein
MLGRVRGVLVSVAETLLRRAEWRRDKVGRAANLLADAATKLLPPESRRGTRPSNSRGRRDV